MKVWHRFQNHNLITYKEGRLTSNLGLQNVGSLTFCNREVIVKKNCFTTVKKIPKKSFSQKQLFIERKFEKCCEAEKDAQEKKQNWRCGIHIEKYLKSHFRDSKLFSISYFEKCFYMQSVTTANFSLVWTNFCTPYCTIFWNKLFDMS